MHASTFDRSGATRPEWFVSWFDSVHYQKLYAHRDDAEAASLVTHLIRRLRPPAGVTVLDLGCGTGRHARHLPRRDSASSVLISQRRASSSAPRHRISNGRPPPSAGARVPSSAVRRRHTGRPPPASSRRLRDAGAARRPPLAPPNQGASAPLRSAIVRTSVSVPSPRKSLAPVASIAAARRLSSRSRHPQDAVRHLWKVDRPFHA